MQPQPFLTSPRKKEDLSRVPTTSSVPETVGSAEVEVAQNGPSSDPVKDQLQVFRTLQQCKDKCYKIVSILNKNRTSDTIEFLATAAYCNSVFSSWLADIQSQMSVVGEQADVDLPFQSNANLVLLDRILLCLERYESMLLRLLGEGKLARFLSNNRVRKQLETQNVMLHTEVQRLEKVCSQAKLKRLFMPTEDTLSRVKSDMDGVISINDAMANEIWFSSTDRSNQVSQWLSFA